MDSLLANYASSDDEAGEAPTAPAPAPAPAAAPAPVSATARGGKAGAKPTAFSSGGGGAGIFSSLPQPKSSPLFSSLPAPKSGPTFSAIPPPKSSANPNKRVVQYRPQPIRQPTGDSSDDEEEDAKKRRATAAEARPAVSAGSGPVSSFLPPPKHSLGLGAGAGAGARRSAIDTAAPERPSLGGAAEPSGSVANTGAPERADAGAADDDDDDDSEDSASEDDMPAPDQQEDDGQLGSDPGGGQQQKGGYDAGAGSTGGYEAYAWDPNYYAQYGANYGWDPKGNANYVTGEQYAAYGGEQGSGYAHPPGGEHVGGYTNVAAAPYGVDYTERYDHEAATTFPPVQDPVLPPMMGRSGGKRGRNDMPAEIVEVNQAELMKNRPKQDTSKLTGLAFGPSYQPAPSAKGKPSKLHKRKHQIGSLYYDMKSKEMELAERRSKGILTKAETQAKYGW